MVGAYGLSASWGNPHSLSFYNPKTPSAERRRQRDAVRAEMRSEVRFSFLPSILG